MDGVDRRFLLRADGTVAHPPAVPNAWPHYAAPYAGHGDVSVHHERPVPYVPQQHPDPRVHHAPAMHAGGHYAHGAPYPAVRVPGRALQAPPAYASPVAGGVDQRAPAMALPGYYPAGELRGVVPEVPRVPELCLVQEVPYIPEVPAVHSPLRHAAKLQHLGARGACSPQALHGGGEIGAMSWSPTGAHALAAGSCAPAAPAFPRGIAEDAYGHPQVAYAPYPDAAASRGGGGGTAPPTAPSFAVGEIVSVAPRLWASGAKYGGVARVIRAGLQSVDVKYVLDGRVDVDVPHSFVRPHSFDEGEARDDGRRKRHRASQEQPAAPGPAPRAGAPAEETAEPKPEAPSPTAEESAAAEVSAAAGAAAAAAAAAPKSKGAKGGRRKKAAKERAAPAAAKEDVVKAQDIDKQWTQLEKLTQRLSRMDEYAVHTEDFAALAGMVKAREELQLGATRSREALEEQLFAMLCGGAKVEGDAFAASPLLKPIFQDLVPALHGFPDAAAFQAALERMLAARGPAEGEGPPAYPVKRAQQAIAKFASAQAAAIRASLGGSLSEALRSRNREPVFPHRWRKKAFAPRCYETIEDYKGGSGLSESEKTRLQGMRETGLDGFTGDLFNITSHDLQMEKWATAYKDHYAVDSGEDELYKLIVGDLVDSMCVTVCDRVNSDSRILHEEPLRLGTDLREQPVWGIDCYTRRNVELAIGGTPASAKAFIEQALLPAINAVPRENGWDMVAACDQILASAGGAGPPAADTKTEAAAGRATAPCSDAAAAAAADGGAENGSRMEGSKMDGSKMNGSNMNGSAPEGAAGARKEDPSSVISITAEAALQASLLKAAVECLGRTHFRIHPKGTGVIMKRDIPAHTFVDMYLGEIYPAWRWGERADGVEAAQKTLGMKPQLPDFYNILLERPGADADGYGLVYVDATRRANLCSSLSHSCDANCNTYIVARHGRLSIAVCTTRAVRAGEELTFDYNSVTSDEDEWCSAICLCGYGGCRGSFLHFAGHDSYMQLVNEKYGPAMRFASLLRQATNAEGKQGEKPEIAETLAKFMFRDAALGPRGGAGLDATPRWLRNFVADALKYIEYERSALPMQLMKAGRGANGDEDAKGEVYTYEMANGEARQMMEQRMQSLLSALSRARRVLALAAEVDGSEETLSRVPLRRLTLMEAAEHLWFGQDSVAKKVARALKEGLRRYEALELPKPSKGGGSRTVTVEACRAGVCCLVRQHLRRLQKSVGIASKATKLEQAKERSNKWALVDSKDAGVGDQNADPNDDDGECGSSRSSENGDDAAAQEDAAGHGKAARGADGDAAAGAKALLEARSRLKDIRLMLQELIRCLADLEHRAANHCADMGFAAPSQQQSARQNMSAAVAQLRGAVSALALGDAVLLAMNTATFVKLVPYPRVTAEPVEVRVRDLGDLPPSVAKQIRELQKHSANAEDKRKAARSGAAAERAAGAQEGSGGDSSGDSGDDGDGAAKDAALDINYVVHSHAHRYPGDYIFSQLMQWYNYGEGTRAPDLRGCVICPDPLRLVTHSTAAYTKRLRGLLFRTLDHEFKFRMPFPEPICRAFGFQTAEEVARDGFASDTVFGSPSLDVLLGDPSGVEAVMDALEPSRDKSKRKKKVGDELRMENAVPQENAEWVQCENPQCYKWRRLPWHINAAELPEKWTCCMNTWDPSEASCDAPQKAWDPHEEQTVKWSTGELDATAMDATSSVTVADDVGPSSRREVLDPTEMFKVNEQVDCFCLRNECWYEAKIVKIQKATDARGGRIRIHFKGWNKKVDEWIFTSGPQAALGRVAPFRSRTSENITEGKATQRAILDSVKIAKSAKDAKKRDARAQKKGRAPKRQRQDA